MKSIEPIIPPEVSQSQRYRYDTVKEISANFKSLSERYCEKIKKYRRNVTIIDVTVYSMFGVMASAGVILWTVTMMVPIAISAATAIAAVATAITKKLSCSQKKLSNYSARYRVTSDAYSTFSELISLSTDNSVISDVEFSAMTQLYNSAMLKLEIEDNVNNNVTRTASTNRREYHSDTNKHDINNINKPII